MKRNEAPRGQAISLKSLSWGRGLLKRGFRTLSPKFSPHDGAGGAQVMLGSLHCLAQGAGKAKCVGLVRPSTIPVSISREKATGWKARLSAEKCDQTRNSQERGFQELAWGNS